jgi:hypothetical protein
LDLLNLKNDLESGEDTSNLPNPRSASQQLWPTRSAVYQLKRRARALI